VVAQVPLGLVTPIAQAFYPRFTQLHVARGADLSQSYHAATQLLTVLIGTATVFLVLLGHPVLMLWLGNPDTVARVESLVAILAIGSMINGLMTLPYFLQLSAGWTSLTIRINLLAILVVTPALFLAVPRFGAIAAAWIWLALNSGYLLLSVPLMHRRLLKGELWAWYLRDVLPPLAAAALVGFLWRVLALPVPSGIVGWCLLTFEGLCMLAAAVMASSYLRDRLRALRRQF
jgi:O-antigen/teichoic acid export membrane protein